MFLLSLLSFFLTLVAAQDGFLGRTDNATSSAAELTPDGLADGQPTGPPPSFDFLTPPGTDLGENRTPQLVALYVLGSIISTGFVGIRIYRTVQIKRFRGDDHLIFFSLVFQLVTLVLVILSVHYGEGKHVAAIASTGDQLQALRLSILVCFFGSFAIVLAKLSVGVTLIQLGLGTSFNILVISTLLVATFSNFFASTVLMAACRTRYLFYTGRDLPCAPAIFFPVSSWLRAIGNLVVDIIFVVAPVWFLRKIRLTSRDRFAVHLLLSFILTATAFSIAKLVRIRETVSGGMDMTYATADVLAFESCEITCCIMAACLPSIRHLLGARFPKHWRIWRTLTGVSSPSSRSSQTKTGRTEIEPKYLIPALVRADTGAPRQQQLSSPRRNGRLVASTISYHGGADKETTCLGPDHQQTGLYMTQVQDTTSFWHNTSRPGQWSLQARGPEWPLDMDEEKGVYTQMEDASDVSDECSVSPKRRIAPWESSYRPYVSPPPSAAARRGVHHHQLDGRARPTVELDSQPLSELDTENINELDGSPRSELDARCECRRELWPGH